MKQIIEKLKKIEQETASEKGRYDLFALFLRENSPNRWDVLIAANWVDADKGEAIKYVAQKIQSTFTPNELILISRVVIIAEDNPELVALQDAVSVENGTAEIKDADLFGLHIKQAFLIALGTGQTA